MQDKDGPEEGEKKEKEEKEEEKGKEKEKEMGETPKSVPPGNMFIPPAAFQQNLQ